MAWAAAAPYVIGAASSLIGGLIGKKGQQEANQMTQASTREQMEFQERMSNTAHQREVADLAAAGLNPILSGTGGRGADAGSGASFQAQNASAMLASGVSSAGGQFAQGRMAQADIKNKEAANALLRMQVEEADARTDNLDASSKLAKAQEAKTESERAQIEQLMPHLVHNAQSTGEGLDIQNVLSELTVPGAQAESDIDSGKYGRFFRYLQRALPAASAVGNAARDIGSLRPGGGVRRPNFVERR